ncbi:hypothetical protein N0V83_000272 [Neocucurbitaria cava]|uniref:Ribosomal protein L19 n=1 Tax=Neocucurbitaria cava TaxID=798079 RepID=A0A9W8YJJ2_9PLEO|nr:hypothetical protein N0V83_000272 [Neocucurbitaria cava]
MSAVVPCTRAAAPRIVSRTTRCRRLMSTEAAAVQPAHAAPILSRKSEKPARRTLSEQMHRAMYPQLYENEKSKILAPKRPAQAKQQKPIHSKWTQAMHENSVQKGLSEQFRVPVFKPSSVNIKKICPNPIATVTASQSTLLDPTGARTRLFAKDNPECARVGDILLVRQRTGDPFAGVCINIRRRGVDTAILLRGQLTRVGVEMWYKVYSPLVEGIEVVQRAAKRARRARLTYMRTVKHDRGSVENVVRMYLRQKAALGTADGKKKGGAAAAAMGGKKTKGRGKKR